MRAKLVAVGWVLLGAVLGAVVTGWVARRTAVDWSRDQSYFQELDVVAANAQALRMFEADRPVQARALLEGELITALEAADRLLSDGARVTFLPLAAGNLIDGVAAAEAYAKSRQLDPAIAERAHRLHAALCGQLSPNSKYRGGCDG